MIKRTEIQRIRDKHHCDIVIHSTSNICMKFGTDDGDIYLKEPIVYDRLVEDVPIKVRLTSICCVTGELYDQNDKKVKYSKLPWRVLKELHRRVVQLNDFTFKTQYV